ncbi:MAG: SDR family NAD(P)-dependent oxidoreductase [Henriciella sp.]
MTEFKNKTAFITGGASGIGLEIARSLALRGTNIMLADINESELASAQSDLAKTGRQIETVVCDVADEAAVRAAAAATEAAFGNVHFLVNNAGVAIGGQAGSVNLDDWRWIVDINLMGVAYGVEIFTPLIKASGGGHIVNVASMAGHWASPGMSPYNATKFAVVGYSEGIRHELAPHNIGVSILCPAWVKTDIHRSAFGRPSGGADESDPQFETMSKVIDSGLDPKLVAEWTADSIAANRLYIFTHPEMRVAIDGRRDLIQADYEACDAHFTAASDT